jgi:hypothetical protein
MLTALMLATAIGAPPDDELGRAAVAVEVAKLALSKPTPAIKQDPYRMEYPAFHAWIRSGGRGVLVVGITDRYVGSYETHCWVPSGFGGLRDGEYDCFGKNEMTPRKGAAPEVAPTLRPFPVDTTQAIVARPVGARSTPSPAGIATAPTTTYAPLVILSGGTNCAPGGG